MNVVIRDHHENDRGECTGCDFSGFEGEPPTWPCRTVALACMGDPDFYFGG